MTMNIALSEKSYMKIKYLCDLSDKKEWIAFLLGEQKDGNFIINDLFLPKQMVNGTVAKVDNDGFALQFEKIANENPELLSKFKGVIHSHNTMESYFSTTDDSMNDLLNGHITDNSIFLSVVVNNKLDFKTKAIVRVNNMKIEVDDVPIYQNIHNDTILSEIKALMTENISEVVYNTHNNYAQYPSSHTYDTDLDNIPKYTTLELKYRNMINSFYHDKSFSIDKANDVIDKLTELSEEQREEMKTLNRLYWTETYFSPTLLFGMTVITKEQKESYDYEIGLIEEEREEELKSGIIYDMDRYGGSLWD